MGVLVIMAVIALVIIIVISLCIHRHLASHADTTLRKQTQDASRDKMAAGHVTYETPLVDVKATDNNCSVV